MTVYVEAAFGGSMRQMLTFKHEGRICREYVRHETFTRKAATEALDLLEYVYKLKRRNIRFYVH